MRFNGLTVERSSAAGGRYFGTGISHNRPPPSVGVNRRVRTHHLWGVRAEAGKLGCVHCPMHRLRCRVGRCAGADPPAGRPGAPPDINGRRECCPGLPPVGVSTVGRGRPAHSAPRRPSAHVWRRLRGGPAEGEARGSWVCAERETTDLKMEREAAERQNERVVAGLRRQIESLRRVCWPSVLPAPHCLCPCPCHCPHCAGWSIRMYTRAYIICHRYTRAYIIPLYIYTRIHIYTPT